MQNYILMWGSQLFHMYLWVLCTLVPSILFIKNGCASFKVPINSVMTVTRHAHIKMNLSTVSGSGMRGQEDKFYSASAWQCWWATPGSGNIFWHSWPMDKLLKTLSKCFWPSLTISELYQPYASFCDHLSTSDCYHKFPPSFTICMQATSYIVRYIPTISDPFIIEVPIILLFQLSSS